MVMNDEVLAVRLAELLVMLWVVLKIVATPLPLASPESDGDDAAEGER